MTYLLAAAIVLIANLASVVAILAAKLRRCRRRERAADLVGEQLCVENTALKAELERNTNLLAHLERCNYILACELHGKAAVDKVLQDARDRGTN
jgi:citrate lyase beta subunit